MTTGGLKRELGKRAATSLCVWLDVKAIAMTTIMLY